MISAVISRDELQELINSNEKYLLIDVRESDELEYGMIPTAKHIALGEVEDALRMAPDDFAKHYGFSQPNKEDVIIFNCRTGSRSARATNLALNCGFVHAKNYAGSVWEWAERDANVKRYGPPPLV